MAATAPQRPVHVALPRIGIRSVVVHLILLVLTGIMLMLSFAPRGHGWLAYVALFPAGLLAARAATARRLAWTAFVVFWGWWLLMINWVVPVTGGGYVALSALMAAYWMLALLVAHQLHKRHRAAMVVLLPIAWVGCEWLRGRFPAGGFSWFMLGQSQGSFTPEESAGRIVQVADLFGELGVSLVLVMSSGLLVDLLTRPIIQPIGQNKHRMNRTTRGALILWLIVIVSAWFYGGHRIGQWDEATQPGPQVAVIQTDVPQDNKNHRTSENVAEDWRDMVELTRQAADQTPTPDLIVWPETMVPGALNPEALDFFREGGSYYSGMDVYHDQVRTLAQLIRINLLVGSNAYEQFTDITLPSGAVGPYPERNYNSAFLYYADGEQAPVRYDKVHRVPFGEYIPWVGSIPTLKRLFIKWFTPYSVDYTLTQGGVLTVFDVPIMPVESGDEDDAQRPTAARVVTPICYEDAVGRAVRRLVYGPGGVKRADIVVNLTNSAWYPGQNQQPQHLQIATLRCIENRVPMARSVNGGISGFIDSLGRVGPVVEVNGQRQWVAGSVSARPRIDPRRTFYGLVGDIPMGCVALLTALLLVYGKLSPHKSAE